MVGKVNPPLLCVLFFSSSFNFPSVGRVTIYTTTNVLSVLYMNSCPYPFVCLVHER